MTGLEVLRAKAEAAKVGDAETFRRLLVALHPEVVLELIDRIEKAEAALRFYADEQNWRLRTSGHGDSSQDVIKDDGGWDDCAGQRAREYFAELEKTMVAGE